MKQIITFNNSNLALPDLNVTGWTGVKSNFKIPYNGDYFVLNTKHDIEVDVLFNNTNNADIVASDSEGDKYEYELFVAGNVLYYDLAAYYSFRLSTSFTPTLNKWYNFKCTNGNYFRTDRALLIDDSVKTSKTSLSTYNNGSPVIKADATNKIYKSIKIYDSNGLLFNIVAKYDGDILKLYDTVHDIWCENSGDIKPVYK